MSSFYTAVALLVVIGLVGSVGSTRISLEQYAFAKLPEKKQPCEAFKLLAEYVKARGLQGVATGDDHMMSTLVDDFRHYSKQILQFSPPDNGKC